MIAVDRYSLARAALLLASAAISCATLAALYRALA